MATKIQYSVHTTNKYSVFDTDLSDEENRDKNKKKTTPKINEKRGHETSKHDHETEEINGVKDISFPIIKEYNAKKTPNTYYDRYNKYSNNIINDLHENSYMRGYRDSYNMRGSNLRSKFARKRGGYSNTSTNLMVNSNYYRGSRNYDYKMDRRNYNSSYNYNKFDYREKTFNDYNHSSKYDNMKRENYGEASNNGRKHEAVTIDYDLYRKQQEKKLNLSKNLENAKKNKNEIINERNEKNEKIEKIEKNSKLNNYSKRYDNNIGEDNKGENTKRKAINVYQYILEEGGRVDKLPGFRRNFRNFKKDNHDNWNNKNDTKSKAAYDEKYFKKRDPPNINDTRAFPSLTSK
ncbi:conserved Plasmodium protein, unknown function [Plasmodium vinckei vinckei]|uniref:Uncharacterized protein n=1 Tax=Plasmodium vinckei vinckei TaxID=54757 RepID=A0A449BXH5_PLAVN|nr:conserved Plasmodium protein, unknown function [Plasmodium vinckei vinckei]KEG04525.1 hypothetical protein YYE_00100 [Plasmodium vinckei vinckei]VEV58175.1 conserved Plasmodium protein, unknown function [Plasmodium vinckei vinckei]